LNNGKDIQKIWKMRSIGLSPVVEIIIYFIFTRLGRSGGPANNFCQSRVLKKLYFGTNKNLQMATTATTRSVIREIADLGGEVIAKGLTKEQFQRLFHLDLSEFKLWGKK
jgi:hypothetical protein